jgi:hypothetical protein
LLKLRQRYGKDKEKLLGILEIYKEFFMDPSNGLIKSFDYFKNPEDYKKTTNYKEFIDSIEKIKNSNDDIFEEQNAKKLTSTDDDGHIEALRAKNDNKEGCVTTNISNNEEHIGDNTEKENFSTVEVQESPGEEVSKVVNDDNININEKEARMERTDEAQSAENANVEEHAKNKKSWAKKYNTSKLGRNAIAPNKNLSTKMQIEEKYKTFYINNNNPQFFYIISFVDEEIFFPLITLNHLLGEKKKKKYVHCY